MEYLGVDPSIVKQGWARGRPGMNRPEAGCLHLPKVTKGDARRYLVMGAQWLIREIESGVRWVGIETPFVGADPSVYGKQCELIGVYKAVCYDRGAEVFMLAQNSWRLEFFGHSKAPKHVSKDIVEPQKIKAANRKWLKHACIREAHRRGWLPEDNEDDDTADACGILNLLMSRHDNTANAENLPLFKGFLADG